MILLFVLVDIRSQLCDFCKLNLCFFDNCLSGVYGNHLNGLL